MKPKSQEVDQGDLYRTRLDQILNRQHPLFALAGKIDWTAFHKEFGSLYVEKVGRHARPIRLLAGCGFNLRKLLWALSLWRFKEPMEPFEALC